MLVLHVGERGLPLPRCLLARQRLGKPVGIEGNGIGIVDLLVEVPGPEAAVARGICLGKEPEAGHTAGGSQMKGASVAADKEGEAAGEACQFA